MKRSRCYLALAVLLGLVKTSAMADPGDLLQTFLSPRPNVQQVYGNYWLRCAFAAVGKNIVVGSSQDDTFGVDAGAAYLFDTSTGEVLRTFKSPEPGVGYNFGCAVAAVGNRIVIGEYRANRPNRRRAGAAYMFDASTGELLHTLAKPSPAVEDYFGQPVGVLGKNFLVTCERDDVGAKNGGAMFMYDGTTGELLQVFRKPNPAPDDGFGRVLAAAGDDRLLVGDDLDDTKGTNAGAAQVLDGTTGELIHTFYCPALGRGHGFGKAVAWLGRDVLVGEKSLKPSRAEGGTVYLFDGDTGELLRTFENPNPVVDDGFGLSVAALGDNVLIGANHAHANGLNVGAAYLFDGSTGELLHTFLNPTPSWEDQFGARVGALGANVVIAAFGDDTAGINTGALYLLEGGSSAEFKAHEPPVTKSGTPTTRLYVRTNPPGAKVSLDGRSIGTSPGLFFAPPGDCSLTVELKGYEPHSQQVKVLSGQITRMEVQLKRTAP